MVATRYLIRKHFATHPLVSPTTPSCYRRTMTKTSTRQTNLLTLIHWAGSIAKLASRTGLSEKYISQVKNGYQGPKDKAPRKFGADAEEAIEHAYQLPRGWLDMSPELAKRYLEQSDTFHGRAGPHVAESTPAQYVGSVFSARMNDRLKRLSPDAIAMLEASLAHILDSYDAAQRKAQLNA